MIQVLAEELYKAVKAVKITQYSHMPILNHARLHVDDTGYLLVTVTDLENPKTVKVSCRWDEPIDTCVPMILKKKNKVGYNHNAKETLHTYHPFLDYLRVMAEYKELLTLELDPKRQILHIQAGNSRTEFKCIDAQEFPNC